MTQVTQPRPLVRVPRRLASWLPEVGDPVGLIVAILAAGVVLTISRTLFTDLRLQYDNASLHAALETGIAILLIFVMATFAARVWRDGRLGDLLILAAIAIRTLDNLLFSVLAAASEWISNAFGTWSTTGADLLVVGLLMAAVVLYDRPVEPLAAAVRTVIALSVVAFGLIAAAAALLAGVLPPSIGAGPARGGAFSEHPALILVETVIAVGRGAIAIAFARRAARHEDRFMLWVAIWAAISGVAFMNYAIFPSHFSELIHFGDLFLILAAFALLTGTLGEMRRISGSTLAGAVIEERRRMARDLHDGVAQELAFIASHVRSISSRMPEGPRLEHISAAADRALEDSRAAISALRAPLDEAIGSAVERVAQEVATRVDVEVDIRIQPVRSTPPDWHEPLLRILRESILNAARHGEADLVTVQLGGEKALTMTITDDGVGFDATAERPVSNHFGLVTMDERVRSIGGRLSITSAPGHGTRVEVVVP